MADTVAKVVIVGEDKLSGVLDHIGDKAGGVGNLLAGALGVGVAALGGLAVAGAGAVATFADFDKTISAIGAVSGASAGELRQLHDAALQLGKDTSFSAKEAAQGMEELAKAGLSVESIIGGGAKAALDLAAAGGVSVADAAAIAAGAMGTFNLKADDLGTAADRIAGFANATAGSVTDFKFSMAAAGSVAAMVGMSFEDTSTAISLLGKHFIFGSDAGTSLKTMLTNLTPKTQAAREAFAEYGLSTVSTSKVLEELSQRGLTPVSDSLGDMLKQLARATVGTDDFAHMTKKQSKAWGEFTDAALMQNRFFDETTGKLKGLDEIAGILNETMGDLGEEEKLQALYKVFGSDAIRAGSVLLQEGAEGVRQMNDALTKVSASDVADQRLNNLSGSIEKMTGSAETLAIMFGERLAPGIRTAVDATTEFLNGLISNDGLQQFVEEIGTGLSTAITSAIDGLGKLKEVLTSTGGDRAGAFAAFGFSPEEAQMLGAAFDDVQLKVTAFGQAAVQVGQQVGPALLAVKDGALALAVAWSQLDGGTKDVVTTLATLPVQLLLAVATLQPLRDAWSSNFGDIQGKTLAAADAVGTFTAAIRDGNWGDAFSGLGTIVAQTGETIASTFQTVSDTVASAFDAAASAVGDFAGSLVDQAGAAFSEFVAAATDTGSQLASAVGGWLAPVTEFAEGFGNAVRIITTFYALELVNGLTEIATGIASATAAWLAPITEWAGNLWASVSGGIAAFVAGVTGWGAETTGTIQTGAGNWLTAASEWIGQAWSAVSSGISTFVSGVASWIGDQASQLATGAQQWLTSATEWAGNLWAQTAGPVAAYVGSLISAFADAAGRLASAGGEMASNLISGFVGGITAGASAAVNAVRGWAESVISAAKAKYDIQSPSKVFAEIGSQVVAGFVGGVEDNAPDAVAAVTDLAGSSIDAANDALQNAPSRRMYEVGGFFVSGMARGIDGAVPVLVDAVQGAVDAAVAVAQNGYLAIARQFSGAITGPVGGFTTELARRIRDANEGIAKAEEKLAEARVEAAEKAAKAASLAGKKGYDEAVKAANEAAAKVEEALKAVELAQRKTVETVADAQTTTAKSVAKAAEEAEKAAAAAAKKSADEAKKSIADSVKAAKEALDDFKSLVKSEMPGISKTFADALDLPAVMLGELTTPAAKSKVQQMGSALAKQFATALQFTPADRAKLLNSWMPDHREPALQNLIKSAAQGVVDSMATALKSGLEGDDLFTGHWSYLINKLSASGGFLDKMVAEFDKAGKDAGAALKEGVVKTIEQLNALGPLNLDNLLPGKPSTPPGNGASAYNGMVGSYQQQFAGMTGQDIIAFFQARGLNPGELIGPYLQGTTDLATFQQQAAQWFSGNLSSGLWSPTTGWRQPVSGLDSPFDKDPTLSGGGVNQGGAPGTGGTGGGAGDAPGGKSGRSAPAPATVNVTLNANLNGIIDKAELMADLRREMEAVAYRLLYGGGEVGVSFGAS